ncbi:MAG TPA: hypothetical protein VNV14_06230 [Opitutaceae bacterium]|jgi:hypothetical protein|nr:hypothetical protein [Opitutaceae bacterium]
MDETPSWDPPIVNRPGLTLFALFNPRFRAVYRIWGIGAILFLSFVFLAYGFCWLAPWERGYTHEERNRIWYGIFLLPFGSIMAAGFIVESLFKIGHLFYWTLAGKLRMDGRVKFLAAVSLVLFATGVILFFSHTDYDVWGQLLLILSIPPIYGFIVRAWDLSDQEQTPISLTQNGDSSRGSE